MNKFKCLLLAAFALIMLSTIGCSKNDAEVVIPQLSLETDELYFDQDGGYRVLVIDVNSDWTVSSDQDWVHFDFTSGTGKEVNPNAAVTVHKNPLFEDRTATITVKCGSIVKTVKVIQKRQTSIVVSSDDVAVSAEGGTISIPVSSNTEYTIKSGKEWISHIDTRAMKDEVLVFNIAQNDSYDAREGKIELQSTDKRVTRVIKINQSQIYLLRINGDQDIQVGLEGAVIEVETESSIDYIFKIQDEAASWISEVKENAETRGLVLTTHKFKISRNDNYESRKGNVTFTGEDGSSVDVNILQKGNPVIEAKSVFKELNYLGGNVAIEINCNFDYAIINDNSWITDVNKTSDKIMFTVSKNNTRTDREGVITLSDPKSDYKVSIKVSQRDYIEVTNSCTIGYKSSSTHINVKSNTDYTVVTEASWISNINKDADGITFNFAENYSLKERSANIVLTDLYSDLVVNATVIQGVNPTPLVGMWKHVGENYEEYYKFEADGKAHHIVLGAQESYSSFTYKFDTKECKINITEGRDTWTESIDSFTGNSFSWDGTFNRVQPTDKQIDIVGTWKWSFSDGEEIYTFGSNGTAVHKFTGQRDSSFKYLFFPELNIIVLIEEDESWPETMEYVSPTSFKWGRFTYTKQ